MNILSTYNVNVENEEKLTENDLNKANMKNINDLENVSNLGIEHIQICDCGAHTAHFCSLDVTNDDDIKGLILSCRNLTKYICNPLNGFEHALIFRNLLIPQLDCSTRWGSTYNMIQTLLAAKEVIGAVESVGNKSIDENFDNTDALWDFIESYSKVFSPLQEAIVKFQSDNLHYGNFYAQWLKCKMLTNRIVEINSNDAMLIKIGIKLLESIEKRTSKLLENESLNACLFLDPRFHHTLTLDKRQEAVVYLKNLWEKLQSISAAPIRIPANNLVLKTDQNFDDEAEEMLNSFLTDKFKATISEKVYIDVHSKIANLHLPFMRSDTDILHYWRERKYSEPEIYALSNVCFGIPPTQVTIEKALSSLKLIMTSNRDRISNETLERLHTIAMRAITHY